MPEIEIKRRITVPDGPHCAMCQWLDIVKQNGKCFFRCKEYIGDGDGAQLVPTVVGEGYATAMKCPQCLEACERAE